MRIVPGSHSAQTPQGRNGMAPLLKAAEAPSWPPQPLGAFLCAAISVYCNAYRRGSDMTAENFNRLLAAIGSSVRVEEGEIMKPEHFMPFVEFAKAVMEEKEGEK